MPTFDKIGYVVIDKDGVKHKRRLQAEEPLATVKRVLGQSRRRQRQPRDGSYEADSDTDDQHFSSPVLSPSTSPSSRSPSLSSTSAKNSSSIPVALPATNPTESATLRPSPLAEKGDGRPISQTTEHLLIAAGSIGATIIIVMVVLGIYTMRKHGLTVKDVIQHGRQQLNRGPPPASMSSRYGQDKKYAFDDERGYGMQDSINAPRPAAMPIRTGSQSSQKRLEALGRSDSFHNSPTRDGNQSFFDDDISHSASHRRDNTAAPSSPVFPIEGQRRSAASRHTRSLDSDSDLHFAEAPQRPPSNHPAPPTFRQFLSNRPSISQRPAFGGQGGMASRFSWTNSNAPQTPHDPSRDTLAPSVARESFMTSRSSVPRFRTVDSWVNQQSNRIEEQRLKQQFRMTLSTTCSDDDVPEMPALPPLTPKNANEITRQPSTKSGLVGKDIKHQRHDTQTTAPIFKVHPGTEVRFSTRSAVPSEILDRGRVNAAL